MTPEVIVGIHEVSDAARMADMQLTASREYDQPPAVMWDVISDLDGYAAHTRGLAATEVLEGNGHGAVRRCETTGGDDWTERVVEWDPGSSYAIEVDTHTYPPMLRRMFRTFRGSWRVEPHGTGSRVTIEFVGEVRGGRVAAALIQKMASRNLADIEDTLESYGQTA